MRLGGEDEEIAEAHEINVTPFIDVMLVLLIIFMVAAPLATVDVAVNLPASTAQPEPRPDKPLYVTIRADRSLAVGEASVASDELGAALRQASGGSDDGPVFVRADKGVAYGDLMDVLNSLRDAGFAKVALVGLDARRSP
jgi:biopolymer transport protein ExbD